MSDGSSPEAPAPSAQRLAVLVGRVALYSIRGELDGSSAVTVRHACRALTSYDRIVLDLSDVLFIDSGGLGGIIGIVRSTQARGGQICIVARRPNVVRLFDIVGLSHMVRVVEDVGAAVDSVAGGDVREA
jgi:anti-anti-sigma factor